MTRYMKFIGNCKIVKVKDRDKLLISCKTISANGKKYESAQDLIDSIK